MKDEVAALVRAVSSSTAVLSAAGVFKDWVIMARRSWVAVKVTQRRLIKQLIGSLSRNYSQVYVHCKKKSWANLKF